MLKKQLQSVSFNEEIQYAMPACLDGYMVNVIKRYSNNMNSYTLSSKKTLKHYVHIY